MILAFVVLLILVALSIDLLWAPTFFCAVAAMHWTASLHLPDPLAPLYAFFVAGVAARTVIALLFQRMRPRAGRGFISTWAEGPGRRSSRRPARL